MEQGWRVDPDRPDRLRWWTGTAWSPDTAHPAALRARARRVRTWATVSLVALGLSCLGLLLAVRTDLRNVERLGRLETLVDRGEARALLLEVVTSAERSTALTWAPLLVAALAWSTWHFHLVQLLPSPRMTGVPDQHALLWWLPVVNVVVTPYLLLVTRRRLQGRDDRRPTPLLAVWWLAWAALLPYVVVTVWGWLGAREVEQLQAHYAASVGLELYAVVVALLGAGVVVATTRDAAAYAARVPEVDPVSTATTR